MFSQLAERSARFLPADLCTDHARYVKNHKSAILVPRARRFLVTWLGNEAGRLQIKPSGSGDENEPLVGYKLSRVDLGTRK